jgi:probable rRNA maturation factor
MSSRHRPTVAQRRRSRPVAAPVLDIVVRSPLWQAQRGAQALLRRAISEAAAIAACRGGELAILLVDDEEIRALNRDWRGRDAPTNVLSFPTGNNPSAASAGGSRDPVRLLGDIVIAYETTAHEATAARMPFRHHVVHLAVHGFLHLMGYDHAGEEDAEAMEALEVAVLARLDVPNPYAMRDARL